MRLLLSTTALFYSLAMTANAAETMAKDTPDDIQLLVSRLNLDSYKKSIKGLTQFGDRRQGTQRNAKAIDWIEQQLRDVGCENIERLTYHFEDKPRPTRALSAQAEKSDDLTTATGGPVGRNGVGPGGASVYGYRVDTSVNRDLDAQPDERIRKLNEELPVDGKREEIYIAQK